MNSIIPLGELSKLLSSDDSIACPRCGHNHSVDDGDIAQHVVSYWGDDIHNLCCSKCDQDFVVREIVRRNFETAATPEGLP